MNSKKDLAGFHFRLSYHFVLFLFKKKLLLEYSILKKDFKDILWFIYYFFLNYLQLRGNELLSKMSKLFFVPHSVLAKHWDWIVSLFTTH